MEFLEFLKEENKHTYKPDNCKSKFKIKDIFNDHWYSFLEDNPNLNIRPIVHEEVEKMMGCGSLSNGYVVLFLMAMLFILVIIVIIIYMFLLPVNLAFVVLVELNIL